MLVRVGKPKFEEEDRGKAVRVSNPFQDWGKGIVKKKGALEKKSELKKKGMGDETSDGIYNRHEENVVVANPETLREDWV